MKYNYKDHKDIDTLMVDYILAVNRKANAVEDVPLQVINEFLNEQEDWFNDRESR